MTTVTPPPPLEYLRSHDVARALGVDVRHLWWLVNRCRSGRLTRIRHVGGQYVYPRRSVAAEARRRNIAWAVAEDREVTS